MKSWTSLCKKMLSSGEEDKPPKHAPASPKWGLRTILLIKSEWKRPRHRSVSYGTEVPHWAFFICPMHKTPKLKVDKETNLLQTPHHIRGVTNCSPACSAGISGVHLVLLFLYVLLHVSPVWYYLLQTASYLGAASTVFYNKPGRVLNEPITRATGRRGFCEPLSACPLLSLGGGMKLLRGELKWAFAGRSTLNRTGMVHLEIESGLEGTQRRGLGNISVGVAGAAT